MPKSVRLNQSYRHGIIQNVTRAVNNKFDVHKKLPTAQNYLDEAVAKYLTPITEEVLARAKEGGVEDYIHLAKMSNRSYASNNVRIDGHYCSTDIPLGQLYSPSTRASVYEGSDFIRKFQNKWAIAGKQRLEKADAERDACKVKASGVINDARSIIQSCTTTERLEEAFENIKEYYPTELLNALN